MLAQTPDYAEELEIAEDAKRSQHWEMCALHFAEAFKIKLNVDNAFEAAVCFHRAANKDKAIEYYNHYLKHTLPGLAPIDAQRKIAADALKGLGPKRGPGRSCPPRGNKSSTTASPAPVCPAPAPTPPTPSMVPVPTPPTGPSPPTVEMPPTIETEVTEFLYQCGPPRLTVDGSGSCDDQYREACSDQIAGLGSSVLPDDGIVGSQYFLPASNPPIDRNRPNCHDQASRRLHCSCDLVPKPITCSFRPAPLADGTSLACQTGGTAQAAPYPANAFVNWGVLPWRKAKIRGTWTYTLPGGLPPGIDAVACSFGLYLDEQRIGKTVDQSIGNVAQTQGMVDFGEKAFLAERDFSGIFTLKMSTKGGDSSATMVGCFVHHGTTWQSIIPKLQGGLFTVE